MTDELPPTDAGVAAAPSGGILTVIRKHPRAWLLSALAVLFVILGTGSVFAGVSFASTPEAAPGATEEAIPPRPQPSSSIAATRVRTCSIAALATDPRLMTLYGSVQRADTREQLFQRNGATGARTGSVMKVITAAAALEALGPDFRIKTSVNDSPTPGTISLVGRGDATLSAMPPGTESVYAGAPKLADLAKAAIAAYEAKHPGVPITSIVLDAGYWNAGDKWDPSWKRSEQTIGYHSEVTALQVDGDRADPTRSTSPRSTDPIKRAGEAFLAALRNADTSGLVDGNVSLTTGSATGSEIASVQSQPIRSLIPFMLLTSDNTLAEMLARIVSKESGFDGSAASLKQAIPSAVFPTDSATAARLTIIDGSGLSENNAIPATVMSNFMSYVEAGTGQLAVIRDALPVAGKSGTLSSRFSGGNAVLRGNLTAKTGWIDTAYTLAGWFTAADGTKMTFAFYAVGDGISASAKEAIDTLATGAYTCGDNLSNN